MGGVMTIKVNPGGQAVFLYSDDSPLRRMGKMELVRASNVLWNEDKQRWFIKLPDKVELDATSMQALARTTPGGFIGKPEGYEQRMHAIADEIQILNKMLGEGLTVEQLGFA